MAILKRALCYQRCVWSDTKLFGRFSCPSDELDGIEWEPKVRPCTFGYSSSGKDLKITLCSSLVSDSNGTFNSSITQVYMFLEHLPRIHMLSQHIESFVTIFILALEGFWPIRRLNWVILDPMHSSYFSYLVSTSRCRCHMFHVQKKKKNLAKRRIIIPETPQAVAGMNRWKWQLSKKKNLAEIQYFLLYFWFWFWFYFFLKHCYCLTLAILKPERVTQQRPKNVLAILGLVHESLFYHMHLWGKVQW